MSFQQNTIAIVYDFDGTLSPQPMQNETVFKALGINSQKFWQESNKQAEKYNADKMLTYMRLLVKEFKQNDSIRFDRDKLQELGKNITYFEGVEQWFSIINDYVIQQSNNEIKIKHYIISAGLKELLNGISIKHEFANIFACEYHFDAHDRAGFPTIVVNDTNKTQYLFRINKGKEEVRQSINQHMPSENRAIPFENILYIGDGETDVPCMTLTRENGGHAIAVYPPNNHKGKDICRQLFKDKRIDYFAPADYTKSGKFYQRVQFILDSMIANILLKKDKYQFQIDENLLQKDKHLSTI